MPYATYFQRNRIKYALATLAVMAAGLLSRKAWAYLPGMVNSILGDALWAAMVYLLCCMLFHRWRPASVLIVALSFCYLIEVSQLYQAPWINTIRGTRLGALVLGSGFLWMDFLAYAIGVAVVFLVDKKLWSSIANRR